MQNQNQQTEFRIRSFICRQGRITQSQQSALSKLSKKYCLGIDANFGNDNFLDPDAPLFLEIGFGNGESLVKMAIKNPNCNFIGIEVHKPGIGHLLLQLELRDIQNVRVFCHDAIEVLEHKIENNSLSGVYLFFPDPWPKRKHYKRRIMRPDFLKILSSKLKSGGIFHTATDWEQYAQAMLALLNQATAFSNTSTGNNFCPRPTYRPLTKFEKRGIKLGHGVWDLIYCKN